MHTLSITFPGDKLLWPTISHSSLADPQRSPVFTPGGIVSAGAFRAVHYRSPPDRGLKFTDTIWQRRHKDGPVATLPMVSAPQR